jgi:hypothetical protein
VARSETNLTVAQQSKLDRLAEDHPETRVVGWFGTHPLGGPVIEYREGRRYVNRHGRLLGAR